MGRNGNSDDVAQAVLFFSTGPHFITGQTLVVDGGLGLNVTTAFLSKIADSAIPAVS